MLQAVIQVASLMCCRLRGKLHGRLLHLLFTGPACHQSTASYIADDRNLCLLHLHLIPPLGDPCWNIAVTFFFFFQSVLCWSVAVSTIYRHLSRVVAFLEAVAIPKFKGPRSASIAWSQVWQGLPAGRFQSGGTCQIHAARARWWSSQGELRAI